MPLERNQKCIYATTRQVEYTQTEIEMADQMEPVHFFDITSTLEGMKRS